MSMDRKKSKYLSETKFWAVGSLKAEKTRGGHNGPPLCGHVIPDPMWNRVNSSFKIENFKGLSKLDIHEAGLARDTLLLNLDLVKDKVSECKKYLQIHKHDFENLNEREQRQIIAAAVGIIGGIVYSQVTRSEALRVLQKDNEIISDTVEMNILKISQTERDVKILNKTDEILKKELLKLFDKTETQSSL